MTVSELIIIVLLLIIILLLLTIVSKMTNSEILLIHLKDELRRIEKYLDENH